MGGSSDVESGDLDPYRFLAHLRAEGSQGELFWSLSVRRPSVIRPSVNNVSQKRPQTLILIFVELTGVTLPNES